MFPVIVFLCVLFVAQCDASNFWIVTRVTNIETNTDCLAKSCFTDDLLFRISHSIPRFNESSESEWSANAVETMKEFTSVWTDGIPEDVQAQLSVINYDPSFGFPRVCDSTNKVSFYRVPQYPGFESSENTRVFRLEGRCFNATLLLQKHEEKCPWCQDTAVGNPQMLSSNMSLLDRLNDPYFVVPLIISAILIVAVFALLITLICVLSTKSAPSKESFNDSYPESELNHSSSDTSGSFTFVKHLPSFSRSPMPYPQEQTTLEIDDHNYAQVYDV